MNETYATLEFTTDDCNLILDSMHASVQICFAENEPVKQLDM
jgi:hypothetical protein